MKPFYVYVLILLFANELLTYNYTYIEYNNKQVKTNIQMYIHESAIPFYNNSIRR